MLTIDDHRATLWIAASNSMVFSVSSALIHILQGSTDVVSFTLASRSVIVGSNAPAIATDSHFKGKLETQC